MGLNKFCFYISGFWENKLDGCLFSRASPKSSIGYPDFPSLEYLTGSGKNLDDEPLNSAYIAVRVVFDALLMDIYFDTHSRVRVGPIQCEGGNPL